MTVSIEVDISIMFNDLQHTKKAGAKISAESVAAGLKQLKDCPLASYLIKDPRPGASEKKQVQTTMRTHIGFDFSSAPAAAGRAHVAPDMVYSEERGYGFEPGAALK
jgi:hypothetical protein